MSLALLHPKIGVALVDFALTTADAAGRLRRALDDRRFPAIFGGYPPIVQVVLPEERLPELGHVLAAAFKAEPQFALEGEDSWVPTARAALEERPAAARSAAPDARRRDVSPWRAAVFIAGAMAAGAGVAAVVVMPPGRGSGNAPNRATVAAMTAPKPTHLLPEAPLAVVKRAAPAPAAVEPRPVPTVVEPYPTPSAAGPRPATPAVVEPRPATPPADMAAGSDTAFALVPQGAGNGPAPAFEEDVPETLPPAPVEAMAAVASRSGSADEQPRPVPPAPVAVTDPIGPAEGPQPPPTRAAGLVGAPLRAPPPAPPPAATAPTAETASGTRCRDILVKTTLGEGLSNDDKDYMRRGCQRPRN